MNELLTIFSTREFSVIIWSLVIILLTLFKKTIRVSAGKVLKVFLGIKIASILGLYIIYYTIVIFLLNNTILWDIGLLKDSIIWLIFSSSILMFRSVKTDKNYDFIVLLFQDFKFIIYFEFLVNFYTFALWKELIIIPSLSLIAIMHQVASMKAVKNKEYKQVSSYLGNILSIIVILLCSYVFYKIITNYKQLLTYENYKSLLLPIVLILTNLPFYYFLALWSAYESMFVRLKLFYSFKEIKKAKRILFLFCKFNLQKVVEVSKKINFDTTIDDLINHVKSM
ncbi:MAG: hypothetical protein BM557_00390 [Flavobacterium sp. MedPE-SWcel]|uniref:hypothetical protein n=1 Tax=uncultured Flavobacterium sp. TaxID=165435 RepID=UPI00091A5A92|nr:hypothetical protein [uncultured Flavobacterium sp.]OIQ22480.1 MAG: hypothetical protein BM557_00390 [Flavobacterium sp. MedPE-SWcel]